MDWFDDVGRHISDIEQVKRLSVVNLLKTRKIGTTVSVNLALTFFYCSPIYQ